MPVELTGVFRGYRLTNCRRQPMGTGKVILNIRIFDEPKVQCRFENIGEGGVLISDSDCNILFFERMRVGRQS